MALTITNTFTNGTAAVASQMNTNFTDIKTHVESAYVVDSTVQADAAIDVVKINDYSDDASEMQTESDPYLGDAIQQPTDLTGELDGIRYQINQLCGGNDYWYEERNLPVMTKLESPFGFSSTSFVDVTGLTGIDLPNVSTNATEDTFVINVTLTCGEGSVAGAMVRVAMFEGATGAVTETMIGNYTQGVNETASIGGVINLSICNYVFTPANNANKKIGIGISLQGGASATLLDHVTHTAFSYVTIQKVL